MENIFTVEFENAKASSEAFHAVLEEQDRKMQKYIDTSDSLDVSVAVASGILCGLIDSLFVGEFCKAVEGGTLKQIDIQAIVKQATKASGLTGDKANALKAKLMEKLPEQCDNFLKKYQLTENAMQFIEVHQGEQSFIGLLCAALHLVKEQGLVRVSESGYDVEVAPLDIGKWKELLPLLTCGGLLYWVVNAAKEEATNNEEQSDEQTSMIPKPVLDIIHTLAESPLLEPIWEEVCNNFSGKIKEIANFQSDSEGDTEEVSDNGENQENAVNQGTEYLGSYQLMAAILHGLRTKLSSNKSQGIAAGKLPEIKAPAGSMQVSLPGLARQAVPVLLNDTIVCTFYFIRHLLRELKAHGGDFDAIDFANVVPWGNKTIVRLQSIATLTFETADMADAAIRAVVESAGCWPVAVKKFVSKLNYVGATRCALSVVAEVSILDRERQDAHERRMLLEQYGEEAVASIHQYRDKMEHLYDAYKAEQCETYLMAFNKMDDAISKNDEQGFFEGNIMIQKVFGKEQQYHNMEEFDAFMDSDFSLQL